MEPRLLLTGTWNALTNPVPNISANTPDGAQTMMLLSDGTVMVHGTVQFQANPGGPPVPRSNLSSAAWYKLTPVGNDYIHGTWTTLASMSVPRKFFPSVVLPSGKVLVEGGEYTLDNNNPPNEFRADLSSGEIYDPLTNTWSNIKNFNTTGNSKFGDDPIEMLPNGTLLAGYEQGTATYIYNPSADTWTRTGDKGNSDQSDEESWVTMPDGSIISYDVYGSTSTVGHSQRYFPSTGTWMDAGNLPFALSSAAVGSELGPAFLLPNGDAWFTGGNGNTAFYTPSTNSWRAGPALPAGDVAADAPGAMLPNGHVLIAASPVGTLNTAGNYTFPGPTRVYEFDPTVPSPTTANSYTNVTPTLPSFGLTGSSFRTCMLVLPNGHVLMCNDSGTIADFAPNGGPQDAWRPYIANITTVGFNIYHVTGSQLTGISEGAAYGDDNEMASNYPIVQLTNNSGQIAYARTFNWSVGVANGGTPQSFDFSLPVNWDPDAYLLTVSASGISSGQVLNVEMGAATTTNLALQPYIFNPAFTEVVANGAIESVWSLSSFAAVMVSGNNADELIVINQDFGGRFVTVNGSGGNDIIRIEANGGSTVVNGDAGDDSIDFSYAGHNLSNISGPTTVNGGAGSDQIFIYDNSNPNPDFYLVNNFGILRPNWGGLVSQSGAEFVSLTTGTAANSVIVPSTAAGEKLFLYSAGGADAVKIGGTNIGAQGVLGDIEIHNSPNYSSLNIDDTNDPLARAIQIDNNGGFGVIAGVTPGLIAWANSDLSDLTLTTGAGADVMAIRAASRPFTILNSGGIDDISMGNGVNGLQSIIGAVTIHAYYGIGQRLTLDDSADAVGRTTSLTASGIEYYVSGLAPGLINYRDFGSLRVFEGAGADSFTVGPNINLGLTVNGGGGDDAFILNAFDNWGEYLVGTYTYPVTFDGNGGYNTLSVNDTTRGNTSYQFYADRFYSSEPGLLGSGADFHYNHMGAIGLSCSNGNNAVAIYGTSSDIAAGNQISIALNGGDDTATIFPHDANGNLTINGVVGIGGGAGNDTMIIDDSAATSPLNYSFSNPFGTGTQDLFGIGAAGMGYTSDFEHATIKGGSGNDTFTVNQYTSGVPLAIYGGAGDDTLNLGGNNLPSNIIMPSGSFLFDGQAGFDRFNLNNSAEISQWTYTGNGVNFEANRGAPVFGYDVLFTGAHNEEMTINAGPSQDTFLAPSAAVGSHMIFNGAGGLDTFQAGIFSGALSSMSLVRGRITFDAGTPTPLHGGNVVLSDSAETGPITAHLDATTAGAYPGDNLFGPGGSVEFFNATSVSLTLGSGADTVYAQPNSTAAVTIAGGNPTAAPGDTLNLALAPAVNSVQHGTPASGSVTSDNLKTLTYSGFESGPNVDAIAPAVLNANINLNGIAAAAAANALSATTQSSQQSIDIQFSEDVTFPAGAAALQLTNTTTGQTVPVSSIAVSYDPVTHTAHFTFPGFPLGILPDGNYHGVLLANSTHDLFGNALAADAPFNFFFLSGDANHDGAVNFNDLLILAQNYNRTGASFSQADFNYDGTVDFNDLLILAQHYNNNLLTAAVGLPAAAAALPEARPHLSKLKVRSR